jgi:hypothetical protein
MAYLTEATKQLTAQLRLKGGAGVRTLTGNVTCSASTETFCSWDPGGASRDVTLTAEETSDGLFHVFINEADAAENLVIKNDAGSTITTIGQGEWSIVACSGSAWFDANSSAFSDILASNNVWTGTQDFGVSGTGVDVTFYGDTATRNLIWDMSADALRAQDNTTIGWGSGAGTTPDIGFLWNATSLVVSQLTANSAILWGLDGAGIDHVFYGDTASAAMTWDQSADALVFSGAAKVTGLRTFPGTTPPAITGATTLVLGDSGGVFTIAQTSAYDIALPDPTTAGGCVYTFVVATAGAFNVTISTTGASTFIGTIINDVTSVIPATGSTLTIATGTAAIGDTIRATSLTTGLYLIEAVTSAAGGITVA